MTQDAKFRLGIDLTDEQLRTAMTDPEKLARWAEQSGRPFIILNTRHLIKSLEWPVGVEVFQQIVTAIRDYRRTVESGFTETIRAWDHVTETHQQVVAPVMLDETLSLDEIALVRRQLDTLEADVKEDLARRNAVRG